MASTLRTLFLPGMMCDERLFAPQLGTVDAFTERCCVAFDAHDSIESMAATTLDLAGDEPVVLVGLSMGGIVAMDCLRQRPDLVRALVLIDTNHLAESPERREARVPQIARALAGELDTVLIDEMKPLYLAPANRADEALLALVLDMARKLGPDVFAAQSNALAARRDYTAVLDAWRGPTLLLCGEHDALCPPSRHRDMQALMPQAELVVLPDAGHLPTLETPETLSPVLERFLAGVATAAR